MDIYPRFLLIIAIELGTRLDRYLDRYGICLGIQSNIVMHACLLGKMEANEEKQKKTFGLNMTAENRDVFMVMVLFCRVHCWQPCYL